MKDLKWVSVKLVGNRTFISQKLKHLKELIILKTERIRENRRKKTKNKKIFKIAMVAILWLFTNLFISFNLEENSDEDDQAQHDDVQKKNSSNNFNLLFYRVQK